jgi:alkylation response protein AidB-like acyl-CoA dehydrogenase
MDFELTEQQKQIKETVRRFAENEVAPRAVEIDETDEFPWDLFHKMVDMGLICAGVSPEYGGGGLDTISQLIATEEIGRVSVGVADIISDQRLCLKTLDLYGTEYQKEEYLRPLVKGNLSSFALTESHAGSDAAAIRASAIKDGNNYILNGVKTFATLAIDAINVIVFLRTEKGAGAKGISAFVVDVNAPGLSLGAKEKKMGQKGVPVCDIILEDCVAPESCLLGKEGGGFKIAMSALDGTRLEAAAMALGGSRGALENSIAYAKERYAFGKPIGAFQMIQAKIADMVTELEAARLLLYKAAKLRDESLKTGKACTLHASMAKLFATESVMKHATDAVQIFGGYGYIRGYAVERIFRDVKILQIFDGTNEIQRTVIAQLLLDLKNRG